MLIVLFYALGVGILFMVIFEIRKIKNVAELQKAKIAELEALATHDDLTGILNRRGCQEVLERQWSLLNRHSHEGNDFAVLLLDLCLFKKINDTYGHDVGDKVLRFFVKTVLEVLSRAGDTVARRGGDEFLAILQGCTLEEAGKIADKIHAALAGKPFAWNNVSFHVHVSIGIGASRNSGTRIVFPLPEILRNADIDMYRNKTEDHKVLGAR